MEIALYILAGILMLVLVLALIAPKTYDVSRSIEIRRSRSEVFPYMKYLKKQDLWSPWQKRDPDMEKKFTGTDGDVGAISYWNGNKDVGEGEQELTKIVNNERVEGELRFLKPWNSTSSCYMQLNDGAEATTKVTWGFSGRNKFPMSIMMIFMSMDKMVGKDFEEGLASLKEMLENE